jgi:hypothetical protein
MPTINESANTIKEGVPHGVSCEGLRSQEAQDSHEDCPRQGEAAVDVPEARGPDGPHEAPITQVIQGVQEESGLGQEEVHAEVASHEAYIHPKCCCF